MSIKCEQCGKCCEDLFLPLAITVDDDVKKWLEYHGIKTEFKNPLTYIRIPLKCSKLKDGKCSIYENRPQVCRDYNCK